MASKDSTCIVNGLTIPTTSLNNKLKDSLPKEESNNNVMKKNGNSSQLEHIKKVLVSTSCDKGNYVTPIQEFYKGTNIFITGGTGFLGKLLIEKLLRSCPHINFIFMLIRSKKGKTVESRAQEIFQDPLFDRLRMEYPNYKEKIRILSGDCSLPGLGLSTQDRDRIMEYIHIVFNVAATVRFDEKLDIAVPTNIQGTRDLMLLCRDCHNIKAVVHVSTAYSHCYQTDIKEEFYDVPITCDKAVKLVEALDEKILTNITPLLLGGKWPNTYTYTKAIAEDAVRTYGKSIATGVFRPSIIVSTRNEPVAGWIDNIYGPTGAVVGVGLGLIRTMKINSTAVADLVPCDMAVNALIASAWDVHCRKSCGEEDIPIYNYISSQENPITWGDFIEMNIKHSWDTPFYKSVWMLFLIPSRTHIIYKFYVFFLHILPALLIDAAVYSIGQKPKLMKTYEKLHKFSEVISYFSTRQWKFSNSNVQQLWQKLSPEDRRIFDFNIGALQWDEFFRESLLGIRTYLLKEDPRTLPEALKRRYRLFLLHQFVKFVFFCLLLRFVWIVMRSMIPVLPWDIMITYSTKEIT